MCRSNNVIKRTVDYIRMEAISKSKEIEIDTSKSIYDEIVYEDNEGNEIARGKDILLYGEIDFKSKDDLMLIRKKNLINENEWPRRQSGCRTQGDISPSRWYH